MNIADKMAEKAKNAQIAAEIDQENLNIADDRVTIALDRVTSRVNESDATPTQKLEILNNLVSILDGWTPGQQPVPQPKPAAPITLTPAPSEDPDVKETIKGLEQKVRDAESDKDEAERELAAEKTKTKSSTDRIKVLEKWVEDFGKETGVEVIDKDSGKPDVTAVTRAKIIAAVKAQVTSPTPTPTVPVPTIPADAAALKAEAKDELKSKLQVPLTGVTRLMIDRSNDKLLTRKGRRYTLPVDNSIELQRQINAALKAVDLPTLDEAAAKLDAESAPETPAPQPV